MPLLKPEKSLKIISLPDGEDPDSLIKTRGIKAIEELLEEAVHLFEVIWRIHTLIVGSKHLKIGLVLKTG